MCTDIPEEPASSVITVRARQGPPKPRHTPYQLLTVTVMTAPRSVLRWRDAQGIDNRVAAATYIDATELYWGTATSVSPQGGSCDVRCWAGIGLNVMSLHISTENILYGGPWGGGNVYCSEGVPRQCPPFLLVRVGWNWMCASTCLYNACWYP